MRHETQIFFQLYEFPSTSRLKSRCQGPHVAVLGYTPFTDQTFKTPDAAVGTGVRFPRSLPSHVGGLVTVRGGETPTPSF